MAQAEAPVSAQPLCGADECDQLVPKPYDDGWSTHLGAGCDDARACRVSLATMLCPCVVWGQLYEKVTGAAGAGRAVAIASGVAGVLLVATPYLAYLNESDDDDSAYYDNGDVVVVTRHRPAAPLTAYYLGFVELALVLLINDLGNRLGQPPARPRLPVAVRRDAILQMMRVRVDVPRDYKRSRPLT